CFTTPTISPAARRWRTGGCVMAARGLTAAEMTGHVTGTATLRAADAAGIGATSPAGLVTPSTADTAAHAVRLSWVDRGSSMDRAATNILIPPMAGPGTAGGLVNFKGPEFLRTRRSGGSGRASGGRLHRAIALANFIIPLIHLRGTATRRGRG